MTQKNHFFQIAIDGPVAAGKGTIAKSLAAKLKFLYVDTGAMYRTAALICLQHQQAITADQEDQIVALIENSQLHLQNSLDENGNLFTLVSLDGRDVSDLIRSSQVSAAVSDVAALPKVRLMMVKKQQNLAHKFNIIMEGRDIGLRVLPNAQLKLYLTANLHERAKRRLAQLKSSEPDLSLATVEAQIAARDHQDMTRATDPLTIVPDAIVIDTTELTIEQVVDRIADLVKLRQV